MQASSDLTRISASILTVLSDSFCISASILSASALSNFSVLYLLLYIAQSPASSYLTSILYALTQMATLWASILSYDNMGINPCFLIRTLPSMAPSRVNACVIQRDQPQPTYIPTYLFRYLKGSVVTDPVQIAWPILKGIDIVNNHSQNNVNQFIHKLKLFIHSQVEAPLKQVFTYLR